MPNSKDVFEEVKNQILIEEDRDEIESIAYTLLHKKFGISKSDVVAKTQAPKINTVLLAQLISRINKNEPLQYILGQQEFYGRAFKVDPSVLVPRPETELLVAEVISICQQNKITNPTILDIGTGSGCIPITLSLEIEGANTVGTDISREAIEVATYNASMHNARSTFMVRDLFKDEFPKSQFDFIVSNPPYITNSEKKDMKNNVIRYEPSLALFVPDDNPLLFYNEIIKQTVAMATGRIWIVFEINERFGKEISAALRLEGFENIKILRDFSNKDRIVSASLK